MKLYHISTVPNIEVLQPKKNTWRDYGRKFFN